MSDSLAAVLFPTGQVRWTSYRGSSDTLRPWLHVTPDAAWAARRQPWPVHRLLPPPGVGVPVLVWADYGDGTLWPGLALPWCVTAGVEWGDWPPNPWSPPETWPDRNDPRCPLPPAWHGRIIGTPRWATPRWST